MTPAEESLRKGDLDAALEALQNQIRKNPADGKLRVFLFQLLSLMGRWERALKQLDVVGDLDPQTIAMVQAYGSLIQCEVVRAEVFAGKRSPLVFGEPEQWIALLLTALELSGKGEHEKAQKTREEALEAAPTSAGKISPSGEGDDASFEWIADADSRIGPMLETIINGRYQWVPFHRLRSISVEAPTDLRDLVWAPAHLTLTTGGQLIAFIPTRYPGSENAEDSAVRMARKTDWVAHGEAYHGLGQRLLATDSGEYPLLEAGEIALDNPLDMSEPAPADAPAEAPSESDG